MATTSKPRATGEPRSTDPRKERARVNRRRMIEAAYKLFCEQGYSVPLTAIADEAGVAVQTLYFTFHSKVGLLSEAMALAVTGGIESISPNEQPWFQKFVAEPDPRQAIKILVDSTIPIFERTAPLWQVFVTMDPELREQRRHHQRLRKDGYRRHIEVLAKKAPLRRGLDIEKATDIHFALFSPDLFQVMVNELGWTVDAWRKWLTQTLGDALIG